MQSRNLQHLPALLCLLVGLGGGAGDLAMMKTMMMMMMAKITFFWNQFHLKFKIGGLPKKCMLTEILRPLPN